MGAEEGFRNGPCMVDILLFHDKKVGRKEKIYILRKKGWRPERKRKSESGEVGGFWEAAINNTTG